VITAEQWYEHNPELQNYYQGDVLSEISFPSLPTFLPAAKQEVWGILRPRRTANRPLDEVLRNLPNDLIGRAAKDVVDAWSDPQGEHIIAHCRKMRVMLVSRSCDVDKLSRKHLLVSPVITVESLPQAQRTEEKLRDLRDNHIFHWFYLPAVGTMPESYADLSVMAPLHRSFFDDETLRDNLLARLSGTGTAGLQNALSNFYGTKFGFAPPDACPQAGRYACSTCFYSGQPTQPMRHMIVGDFFGDCPNCGEDAIWVKLP
jgi:hypothetical protein